MTLLFLIANGLGFIVFGAMSFLDPLTVADRLGVTASGAHGIYEFRGVYGGVSLGAAVLLFLGAASAAYTRPALLFLLTYTGGYFVARLAALPLDGPPGPFFMGFVVYEGLAAALSAFALTRLN